MKRRPITIWISCSMIIIGIVMVIIGASLGAGFGYLKDYDTESFTREYTQEIKTVDINYKVGNLIIKKGDELKIVADEVRKDSIRTDVSGDKLTIKSTDKYYLFNFGKNSELTVYIPDDLTYFSVKVGAGELVINDITAEQVNIKTGAGEADINNLTSDQTTIKSGVGELKISNSDLTDLNLKAGVGEVNIDAQLKGDCDIKGGIGDINLDIDCSIDDYRFDFSNGIGDIRVNGDSYKKYKHHDGEYSMSVDNGIGDIEIYMD